MASIIRIKRSSTSGNPSTLAAGELAYSALADNGSNGGERLYIGIGTETNGNAANHLVIGGTVFTDRLDHVPGVLTASSALIVDADKKLDQLLVDNLSLNGNTLSTTNANGDLILAPNGTGTVSLTGTKASTSTSTGALIVAGGVGIAGDLYLGGSFSGQAASFTSLNNTPIGNVTPSTGAFTSVVVDNITVDGNSITSTNTNGNITLQPNGTGAVNLYNPYIEQAGSLVTLTEYIQDVAGGGIVDSAEIDSTYDDDAGTTSLVLIAGSIANSKLTNSSINISGDSGSPDAVALGETLSITGDTGITTSVGANSLTIDLDDTTVTPGSYGDATNIPTFTVDQQGRLTAAGSVSVATTLNIAGDTGADGVSILSDTLTFTGGEGIDIAVTDNTVTVSGEDATTTNKGVASFAATNFTVTGGAVAAKAITLGGSTLELGSTTASLTGLTNLGVLGVTTLGGTLGVTGAATLSSTLDVAGNFAVATNKFTVSATSGNTTVAGTMGITGNTTVGGSFGVTGATTLGGTLAVTNDLAINTNKFNVTAASGNTSIAGTLGVTGATTLGGTLGVTGNATVGGTLAVTGTSSFNGTVDMNSNTIANLAEPVNDADAATKYYVDNAVTGLSYKDAVNLHADSNVALTGSTSTLVIDSHAALDQADDGTYRLLLTGQTDSSENGIYVYTDNGTSYTLVRADDADTYQELDGSSVFVQEGTVYANTGWVQTNHYLTSFTGQTWVQFSGAGAYTAGSGLTQSGTIFNVGAGNGITVTADEVSLATSVAGDGLTYTDGVLDVVGTADRITAGANSIDIASTYVGQSSITTLGTITTGVWNGTSIADANINDDLTITGGVINATPIGQTTAAAGSFTTITTSSTAAFTGSLSVNTNKFTVAGTTGNTAIAGTLGVDGNVIVNANLTGAGAGASLLDGFEIDGGTY